MRGGRERARERGDQTQTVVAGEGGACSLPEVGGGCFQYPSHWVVRIRQLKSDKMRLLRKQDAVNERSLGEKVERLLEKKVKVGIGAYFQRDAAGDGLAVR